MANPRSRYSTEFKAEAIRLVLEQNQPQSAVSRNLKISNQTLSNWITKSRQGELSNGSSDSASSDALEAENKRLRKALAVAELERDILKKATAYFARGSL